MLPIHFVPVNLTASHSEAELYEFTCVTEHHSVKVSGLAGGEALYISNLGIR
jgi:hypothetical protein